MREPPPPGECHPAYLDHHGWLRDWLNGAPGYPTNHVKVPVPPRLSAASILDPYSSPFESPVRVRTLIKEKAGGPAPYVGDPFIYVWFVATDELGRTVAGDAHIQLLPQPSRRTD